MIKQRKINTNLGKDTHVRDHAQNLFQSPNYNTKQIVVGEIQLTEPEPLFNQNMVKVKLARGGKLSSVAYPGAFIEPLSGNLHGMYEGPFPGQMVAVGFENGNMNSPFVVNRYPYQGAGNTLSENSYKTPLTKSFFNATDVVIGHVSGSFMSFNTGAPLAVNGIPGSIKINATTDLKMNANTIFSAESLVSAEVKSTLVTLTGSTAVALNGNTNFAVKYTELKTAFDLLRTELNSFITIFNAHVHPVAGVTAGPASVTSSVTATPGTPAAADMSAAQNTKVLM